MGPSVLLLTPWKVGSIQKYIGLSQQLTPSPAHGSCTQDPSHSCTRLVSFHTHALSHAHTQAHVPASQSYHPHICIPLFTSHPRHIS